MEKRDRQKERQQQTERLPEDEGIAFVERLFAQRQRLPPRRAVFKLEGELQHIAETIFARDGDRFDDGGVKPGGRGRLA